MELNTTENARIDSLTPSREAWEHSLNNPLNWPSLRKWTNVTIISLQATLSPIASTILAIGASYIARDFSLNDSYLLALPTGIYILGIGFGPLLLAPCSELYGRRIVYNSSLVAFTILNVGCALSPNIVCLSILRFFAGIAGAASPTLGPCTIGDMFCPEKRGKAQSICSVGVVMGPILGGVVGGFIVGQTNSWAWLMWTVVIASAVMTVISILFLRETYAPYIVRKAIATKDNSATKTTQTDGPDVEGKAPVAKVVFTRAITRPIRILFTSPICAFMSVYMSLVFGIMYLHLITITLLFSHKPLFNLFSYRWEHGTTGLAYLGAGTGGLIGIIIKIKYAESSFRSAHARQQKRLGADTPPTPELRIPFMQVGMLLIPMGLIIFAWSAGRTHWAVPLFGACIIGVGIVLGYICIQAYVVDCFEEWSASAMAAVIFTRNTVTCTFCAVGFQLYKKLDYAWASMLLAFLCMAMIPVPLVLWKYGPRIRAKQPKYES